MLTLTTVNNRFNKFPKYTFFEIYRNYPNKFEKAINYTDLKVRNNNFYAV